jgi:hypothetical protein
VSDNSQLAHTGTVAGAIVVGGAVITGWWLLAIAVGLVAVGALVIRLGFRRHKAAGER